MSRFVISLCALGAALAVGAASRAEDAKPGADIALKDKLEICSGCHGPAGVSQIDGVPNLAGAPDLFTEWQLVYFRGETRMNEQMTPQAKDLTDSDIRDMGAYFLSLPAPAPTGPDSDPALTQAGAKLANERHCAQCHTETFAGQGEVPRLAGQREEFIVKALHDYQHGARRGRGNVIMPEIAYSLNEDDIKAVAHFMSRQPGK
ncbi:c-type cytochrome [Methylocapsa sp. S129]|uniref:c-type cytochrome n=1 Tax=Methylocapsa sp. S129 TaxID=1641869 RepID=UPI00131E541D|nr:c-type cytochrome [Methylocapsa sp. S129]